MTTTRVVLATPRVGGCDGISAVSRQYLRVLEQWADRRDASIEVWSLAGEERPEAMSPRTRFRAAGGRLSFASFALRAPAVDGSTIVVVMHLHLLPAMLPMQRRGARVVVLLHGVEAWKPLRRLEAMAFGAAWKVAAVSRHTAERFRAANPRFAATPIEICHSGYGALPAMADGLSMAGDAQARASRPALIVGRMAAAERYKGHDLLIDVWPDVRARVPGARLVVAGDGDDRRRLEAAAVGRGLAECVTFTGRVSDAELGHLYRGAAMLVMPSRDEGLGLVFLEAMASGCPCVAGRGAAEEIITHGVDGLIVDPDDREAVATAIVALFTDQERREAMGAAAERSVCDRFGPTALNERVRCLLGLDEHLDEAPMADGAVESAAVSPRC